MAMLANYFVFLHKTSMCNNEIKANKKIALAKKDLSQKWLSK